MSKHRKTWNQQEKLEVLEYYNAHGLAKTSRQYDVSTVSISKWNGLYETYGKDGLIGKKKKELKIDHDRIRLERENRELKAIVAEKELQIRIQAEMLKKSH